MEGQDSYASNLDDEDSEISSEEMEYRKSIESEKETYKEGFDKLRQLKATIEHMQKLLEKGKKTMQADFDVWYREMCAEPQVISKVATHIPVRGCDAARDSMPLPAGVQLTGNKETDDDIIAFYKAKEALLARSRRK